MCNERFLILGLTLWLRLVSDVENESVPEMGRTVVEIILFGNETIKFNDNLDRCDEKIQKGFCEIPNTAGEKKVFTWKKNFPIKQGWKEPRRKKVP